MGGIKHSYHLCGIGGSGMLPLALILKGKGYSISGSDRSYDQGRTPEKFKYLEALGIPLYPQDGSGLTQETDTLIVSAAIEESIPDVRIAKEKNIPIRTRAEILSEQFNASKVRIAVAGTSGKTTTTGMIGFILKECGFDPTVMNGGIFKNFKVNDPYCSALVGHSDIFVTECDESDGTISLYTPDIAVLNNIALDHKSLDELNVLFRQYLQKSNIAVLNADHKAVMDLSGSTAKNITYGLLNDADVMVREIQYFHDHTLCVVQAYDQKCLLKLLVPGRHNISNALAAIAACLSVGASLESICNALSRFQGIWRRLDTVGSKSGITVIDDFAHNPDKISASLQLLKSFPGRLLIFFQPHGYGFLKLVWKELANTFADHLSPEDILYMVQPFYAGGTVDRSIDSSHVIGLLKEKGMNAFLEENRLSIKNSILSTVRPGDRIIIMGARDDSLAEFASDMLLALPDL